VSTCAAATSRPVTRLDLLATGDREAVDAAMERYIDALTGGEQPRRADAP
jgi:hypothetical protein